ncbi:MAG: transporter substrate-binding domain-containing protein [Holosporales bacterium]|jgi:ABC-type amino acid transport substrate-binding protein|nr:transporter substrate-binding domain-containing protein [Holosporales bacterium]
MLFLFREMVKIKRLFMLVILILTGGVAYCHGFDKNETEAIMATETGETYADKEASAGAVGSAVQMEAYEEADLEVVDFDETFAPATNTSPPVLSKPTKDAAPAAQATEPATAAQAEPVKDIALAAKAEPAQATTPAAKSTAPAQTGTPAAKDTAPAKAATPAAKAEPAQAATPAAQCTAPTKAATPAPKAEPAKAATPAAKESPPSPPPAGEVHPVEKGNTPPELSGAAPDIVNILARGTLRVGMCPVDQAPFHVKTADGKYEGFDVDLADGLAKALQVKLVIVEVPDWDQTITYLLDGKIDIILSNLTSTPERATKIFCSAPYAKIRQCMLLNRVLVARAGGKGCMSLREIFSKYENRKLLVQEGTSYVTSALSMFPNSEVSATPSWKKIIEGILSKEFMGTISDEIEIKQQLASVQTMELYPVILKDRYDLMVVGVSRCAPQLLHFVNNYIETNNVECKLDN